jgi:hypothetical protein
MPSTAAALSSTLHRRRSILSHLHHRRHAILSSTTTMTWRLHTTYSMLGRNGRTPPAAPQPPPQLDADIDIDFNSDDSRFDEWDEAYIADAEAKATEEAAQWGEQQQVPGDPKQAAILAILNAQRFRRLEEGEREFFNATNFDRTVEISRQRAATEEVGRLLMAAERQKLLELNAQRQAEVAPASKRGSPRTRCLADG